MIKAMIFDLDGTLVRTERLKAISYARAAVELCPYAVSQEEVLEAFKEVVGQPRRQVAQTLVERFGLEGRARERMVEFRVHAPWQAFVQVRLHIYEAMLADPEVLRNNQWPHNVDLLAQARRVGCRTGLATMSHCTQAQQVLEAINLTDAFDFVATRDDVEHGKPDPEIYLLVARELGVRPEQCLVIEDSPTGIEAALAAGMEVIAVTTPFTRERVRQAGLLPPEQVVDDPARLMGAVDRVVAKHAA